MSMFYVARHGAPRTSPSATQRAGVGVLAATALGFGATTMTATSASANGGPEAPAPSQSQSQPSTGGAQSTGGSTSFSDVVQQGDSGSVVEDIQDEVGVSADGSFGPETAAAVEDFQSDEGLAADGVVGPETGSAMGLSGGGSADSGDSGDSSTSSGAQSVSTGSSSGSTSTASSTSSDSSILETARSYIGSPYVMGGTDPSGFDCSGLVQYVHAQHGKDIPRTTQEQQAAATPVSDPQPGDVVFFGDSAHHNGIYAGDGKIVDAGNSSTGVTERDIWTEDVSYGRF